VIVLEGAILVEAQWTNLVNNNIILVDAPEAVRMERLMNRSKIDKEEASLKIERQVNAEERCAMMEQCIADDGWGRLWRFDTGTGGPDIMPIRDEIVAIVSSGVID
jgi:hypothetical protein